MIWACCAVGAAGGLHGWALLHPAGKVDRLLHRIWRTECRYRRENPAPEV